MPLPKVVSTTPEVRKWFVGTQSDGSDRQEMSETLYHVALDNGQYHTFDHAPTDDEIASRLTLDTRIRPTTLAQRVEDVAELCRQWNALVDAAARAATDPAFTAQERTRLTNLRDLAKAALKAYV